MWQDPKIGRHDLVCRQYTIGIHKHAGGLIMSAVKAKTRVTSPDPYSVFLQQMTILGPYLEKKDLKIN